MEKEIEEKGEKAEKKVSKKSRQEEDDDLMDDVGKAFGKFTSAGKEIKKENSIATAVGEKADGGKIFPTLYLSDEQIPSGMEEKIGSEICLAIKCKISSIRIDDDKDHPCKNIDLKIEEIALGE